MEEFLDCWHSIVCERGSDSRRTVSGLVAVCSAPVSNAGKCVEQQRYEAFHHNAPLILLSIVDWSFPSFCSSSSVAASVTLIVRVLSNVS